MGRWAAACSKAMRARGVAFWLALGAAAVVGCGDGEEPNRPRVRPDPRPNIVLLMAEDLGPRLGAYGDAVAHTPNIDRLADAGTRYTRAFATSGVCSPSRAAIITGVHQNFWGAGHMRAAGGGYAVSPPPHVKAFPELLRSAGYYTLNDGKTDYQMGLRLGGSHGGPATLWDDDNSRDWNRRSPGQPFFAYVNLFQTHESQVWPTWMLPDGWLTAVLWPLRIWNHLHWPVRTDPAQIPVPPYYPDTPTVRADLARHYNNIAAMDVEVGRLLDRLESEGLTRNTVVIFASDHGDGLPRAKRWLYDSGLRVPLIVRWPGVAEPSAESTRLVSLVDLAPTLLALAGVAPPDWMQGRVFLGPDEEERLRYVYAARDRIDARSDTVRAVRDWRFKYVRHLQPELPYVLDSAFRDQMPMMREMRELHAAGNLSEPAAQWFRENRDPEELFDTAGDPHELVNLVGDPQRERTLHRLRFALDEWLRTDVDLGLLPESELRDRFSPDGAQPVTPEPLIRIEAGLASVEVRAEGASIEVRQGAGPWQLYVRPVPVEAGETIAARAQRYGWKMSAVVEIEAGWSRGEL